jgi:hypothetical protein
MLPSSSSNDPASYLNHCNIDRVAGMACSVRRPMCLHKASQLRCASTGSTMQCMLYFRPTDGCAGVGRVRLLLLRLAVTLIRQMVKSLFDIHHH